jgi:REP element-mobilizing transposase RayT
LTRHLPVLVTARLQAGLPSLRRAAEVRALTEAFRSGAERFGFRLVHFSIQTNHLHLVAEADDRRALSRGLQGLFVRVARALNRLWRRRGRVFSDRYHDRVLRTPREVRNALRYVLNNHRRHGIHTAGIDPCSSGAWFDGWAGDGSSALGATGRAAVGAVDDVRRGRPRSSVVASVRAWTLRVLRPVSEAKAWLLREGWRQHHGPIGLREVPAGQSPARARPA